MTSYRPEKAALSQGVTLLAPDRDCFFGGEQAFLCLLRRSSLVNSECTVHPKREGMVTQSSRKMFMLKCFLSCLKNKFVLSHCRLICGDTKDT